MTGLPIEYLISRTQNPSCKRPMMVFVLGGCSRTLRKEKEKKKFGYLRKTTGSDIFFGEFFIVEGEPAIWVENYIYMRL